MWPDDLPRVKRSPWGPNRRQFAYPRNDTPFSTPRSGDVVRSTKDRTKIRTVVTVVNDDVEFFKGFDRTKVYVVTQNGWAVWCCKHQAECVKRGDSRREW